MSKSCRLLQKSVFEPHISTFYTTKFFLQLPSPKRSMISKVMLVTIVMLLAAERCSEPLPMLPTCPSSYGNLGIAHHKAFRILSKHSDCNLDYSILITVSRTSFEGLMSDRYKGFKVGVQRYRVAVGQLGLKGDGKKDGWGCYPKRSTLFCIVFGKFLHHGLLIRSTTILV